MIVFLYRPSPQVPKPSVRAAKLCYTAAAFNVGASGRDMDNPAVDITWIFLQSLFMALNTILWAMSYGDVRKEHPREELEEHLRIGINIIDRCRDRWPGCASACQLYDTLSKACLKSYELDAHQASSLSATSPESLTDANSPSASEHSAATTGSLAHSHKNMSEPPPTFGYIWNEMPNSFAATEYHNSLQSPPQPSFRSNSIFAPNPNIRTERRVSYFPPEFAQQQQQSQQQQQPLQQEQQVLPNSWTPLSANVNQMSSQPPSQSTHAVSSSPPLPIFNTFGDPTYILQPQYNYNFGQQFYANNYDMPDRSGSLSHQQQAELMESLENDGLNGIESFLSLGTEAYYDPGKS